MTRAARRSESLIQIFVSRYAVFAVGGSLGRSCSTTEKEMVRILSCGRQDVQMCCGVEAGIAGLSLVSSSVLFWSRPVPSHLFSPVFIPVQPSAIQP